MKCHLLHGAAGLCASRKGTAFLLVLAISSIALMTGKLPGAYFAVVISTIFGVFSASHVWQQFSTNGDPNPYSPYPPYNPAKPNIEPPTPQ